MNIQSLLTFAIETIFCGFIAILTVDLGNRIIDKLFDTFASSPTAVPMVVHPPAEATTPPTAHPAATVEFSAEDAESKPLAIQTPMIEDPWSAAFEAIPQLCCCHTAIASPPQLLLSPAIEVADQPNLAAMPNTDLRKLCQSAGIKWRNAYGTNKHLSKPEMITALLR